MVHDLGKENSLLNYFLGELREENIQKDSMRFRRNLERVGEIFAYEISKTLEYAATEVQTPLGIASMQLPINKIVLSTVLRAGLPMHQGLLNYFDRAENAFISAYRKYHNDNHFTIEFEHISSPNIDNKILILIDPMLATGASLALAYEAMLDQGAPKHTHLVAAIASKEGVAFIRKKFSDINITLWVGAIDDELTSKSYIVPGLGDAGDLAFGSKE
jgi:uracil phosphoribosyltransferase